MTSVPPPAPGLLPHPGAPPEPPERPEGVAEPAPRWPAWTAPVALIAALAAALFGAIFVGAVAAVGGADLDDPPAAVNIVATVVQDAAMVVAALAFARLVAPPRPWHFGLRATRPWPAVGWTLLTWLAFVILSAVWVSALGIDEPDDLPEQLGVDESTLAFVSVAVLVTVVAPIAEEVFFRGYFFTALRSWRGPWLAAILTGVVFGAIHAGSAPAGYLVPLALFGIGLCLLYWRTGSLYPCIALHALNNALAFGVSQGWGWEIPLLMIGANLVIAALLWPLRGRGPQPAAA
jgi:membrane protease YdiL (CAAX protease family)